MVKTGSLSIRIDERTKAALEQAASSDDRSVSYMAEKILREWLTKAGYMQEEQRPSET